MKKAIEMLKAKIAGGMDFAEAVFQVSEKTGIDYKKIKEAYDNE